MENILSARNEFKRRNYVEILNFLRRNGAKPRIEIAAHIKLTKAAVTVITNEMLGEGVLVERGEIQQREKHQRGRRKIMLDINENYKLAFGVALERDQLLVGLTNLRGQALDRLKISLEDRSYRSILELIVAKVQALMKNNCIAPDRILAVGVCVSRSGAGYVEGAASADKLTRLKKDLSHALTMRIITAPTIVGAISAQRLFSGRCSDNMMLLRYGEQIESALLVNGRIYRGFSGRAGGFTAMQFDDDGVSSYERMRGERGTVDGSNAALNEKLAGDISICRTVLDPEAIFGFGTYFETEFALRHINLLLSSRHSQKIPVTPSAVSDATVFLAGCGIAVEQCFYMAEA